jgi:hypothetical protein
MLIDPTILSPVSALLGALIGGSASVAAAVYTQRTQNRLQRITGEVAKREAVYADFVASASTLILNAYTHDDIALGGEEQHLIGLINGTAFAIALEWLPQSTVAAFKPAASVLISRITSTDLRRQRRSAR